VDRDQLIAALQKADAVGDEDGARHLAQALRNLQSPVAAPPPPPPAPEPAPEPAHKGFLDNVVEGAENFGRGITRLPGAAADLASNFGRGVERIAKGDVSLKEAGDVVRAELNSVPGADFAGAVGRTAAQALSGQKVDPAAALAAQRAQHEADKAAMPIASAAGSLVGSVAGASAIEGRAAQAGVTGVAKRAALAAGGTELADSGDLGKAAGAAAAGAAGGKLIETAAKPIIEAIRASDIPLGIKVLAKRLKMDPREVEASRQALVASRGGGPPPSVAEIVNDATKQRLAPVIKSQKTVAEAAKAAEDAGELARPGILKQTVANGQPLTDPQEILAKRDEVFNALVDPVRDKAGLVRPSEAKLLLHPDVLRSLDDTAKQQLMQSVQTGKPTFLTVGQADTVRRSLGRAVQTASQDGANLGALKTARGIARAIGERTAPEYKQAMSAYERGGDLATGAKAGEGVRTADTTATVNAAQRANPDEAAGLELGTRNALANDVGNSFGSSGRAAEQLQNPGLRTRVAANMGQSEADRLAMAGQLESRAARNLSDLNPSPAPKPSTIEDAIKLTAQGGATLSGRMSGGGMASVIGNVFGKLKSLGLSQKAAKALSENLFDPAKSADAVRLLKAYKLDTDARDAIAAGIATHTVAAAQGQGDQ
jgi:hypothetical protein